LITYRVRLDVPRDLVLFVSRLPARHRKETGTRKNTRCLGCYRQALFVLAWYRDKTDIPRLGAGFGLSQATSYRYAAEGTAVIAAAAPGLEEALERAVAGGTPYVFLDGKIVAAGRCREKTVSRKGRDIDLWYPGKKKDSGGNIQGLFYPGGLPAWVSGVLPGNVHDLAAAREMVLPVLRKYTDKMPGLADCGYEGAGHGILTPVKKAKGVKEPDINTRTRNVTGQVFEPLLADQAVMGIQGSPSASMTRASKKLRPCLAAVDR
jgi:DDE superfamily endonuclease